MSVNWVLSPLRYIQETAQTPMQLQMSLKDRFRTSMQEAMLYNPARLLEERKALEEVSAPITQMSYTPQELREMYADTIGNTTPWAKYLNGEGKVNQQVVERLLHRYMATSANTQLMQEGYSNFKQGTASLLGGVVGGLRDPINIALGLIPVYGLEAAVGKAVVGTSPSVLRAFGSRFLSGAAEDMLINGTFATPYAMSIRSELGDNPTMQEYFQTVGMGGLIGGGLRGLGGLVVDPKGKLIAAPKTVHRTETENRITNMPASEIDAVTTYVAQTESRGVDSNVDALLEMSSAFQKSTISAERRTLAEASLAFKSGLGEEPDITIKRVGDKSVAETTLNDIKYSAKAATDAEAVELLNKRILNSINKRILPKVTDNGDGTFTAQYTNDRGPARDLVGHGRSEAEAIRNLHKMYDDAMKPNKKIKQQMQKEKADALATKQRLALLKKDLQEGTVSTYGLGGGQYKDMARHAKRLRKEHADAKAALESKYKADYAEAKTPAEKTRLTKAFHKQGKELDAQLENELKSMMDNADMLEQDAIIREANASNVDLEVFADDPELTEAVFENKLNKLMTNRNEKLIERIEQRRLEAEDAIADNKSIADMEKYAARIDDRIQTSEAYKAYDNGPSELQQMKANYEGLKTDTEILNSKQMDDIFKAFDACERGL